MNNLIEILCEVLSKYPDHTGRFYASILNSMGFEVSKYEVNSTLYNNRNYFIAEIDENRMPSWRCKDSNASNKLDEKSFKSTIESLFELVKEQPYLTGKNYALILNRMGYDDATKHSINQLLYGRTDLFKAAFNDNLVPLWSVYEDKSDITPRSIQRDYNDYIIPEVEDVIEYEDDYDFSIDSFEWTDYVDLYRWQESALNAWQDNGYRGIIEAVTGSGKTRLAIAAAAAHLENGWKILVIVPYVTLRDQWRTELVEYFSDYYDIGYLGDGSHDNFDDFNILLAVVNSAKNYLENEDLSNVLIITDETHHYGKPSSLKFLHLETERRLGITASLERGDEGVDKILLPYFNKVVYKYEYAEAIEDKVIAPFDILFISVPMYEDEEQAYASLSRKISKLKKSLEDKYPEIMNNYHLSHNQKINRLKKIFDEEIGFYIAFLNKRNQMVVNMQSKLDIVPYLANTIKQANGTFVFTQIKTMNNQITDILKKQGVNIYKLDGDTKTSEREPILNMFRNHKVEAISAPKLLDEGIDVPHAELGIITGKSNTKRQMIQRIGRVVRTNNDQDKIGKIIILVSEGTVEDPKDYNQDTFYEVFLTENTSIDRYDYYDDEDDLIDYLDDWMGI